MIECVCVCVCVCVERKKEKKKERKKDNKLCVCVCIERKKEIKKERKQWESNRVKNVDEGSIIWYYRPQTTKSSKLLKYTFRLKIFFKWREIQK